MFLPIASHGSQRLDRLVVPGALDQLLHSPGPVAVNLVPVLRIDVRQLVKCDAHDVAIAHEQGKRAVRESPVGEGAGVP